MAHRAQFEQWIPVEIEKVFLFFANPSNLPRIMPPSSGTELREVKLVAPPGYETGESTITDVQPLAGAGSEIITSFRLVPFLPFRGTWVARITESKWNDHFVDEQIKGPFKSFRHRHQLSRKTLDGIDGTQIQDVVDYEVGFGLLGEIANLLLIQRMLHRMFEYRQSAVTKLLVK